MIENAKTKLSDLETVPDNPYKRARQQYVSDLESSILSDYGFNENVSETDIMDKIRQKLVNLHTGYDDYGSVSALCPVILEYPINYWNGMKRPKPNNENTQIKVGSDVPIDHNYVIYCPFSEIFDESAWTAIYNFLMTTTETDRINAWEAIIKLNDAHKEEYAYNFGPTLCDKDDDDLFEYEYNKYPKEFMTFWYKGVKYAIIFNNIENIMEEERDRSGRLFSYNVAYYNYYMLQYDRINSQYPFLPFSTFGIARNKSMFDGTLLDVLLRKGVQLTNVIHLYDIF
jgi:hypothetical protein